MRYTFGSAVQASLDRQTSVTAPCNAKAIPSDVNMNLVKRIRDGQSKVTQASLRVRQPLLPLIEGFNLPPKERSNGIIGLSSSGSIEAATRMKIARVTMTAR